MTPSKEEARVRRFEPGVYPDNVPDCHAMLRLTEAVIARQSQQLAAVELLTTPTLPPQHSSGDAPGGDLQAVDEQLKRLELMDLASPRCSVETYVEGIKEARRLLSLCRQDRPDVDGWVLVPKEPTTDMIYAGEQAINGVIMGDPGPTDESEAAYKAMLASSLSALSGEGME